MVLREGNNRHRCIGNGVGRVRLGAVMNREKAGMSRGVSPKGHVAWRLLRGGSGVIAAMMLFNASPFWNRKVRLAVLTLATFIALC